MATDRQLTPRDNSRYGRRLAALENVPLDIAYHVADHCTVEELVTLRTLSKPLRDLLSDPGIWKMLYKRAPFPLPPGPYDWQTTSHFVKALLRADKHRSVRPWSWRCLEFRGPRQNVHLLFKGDVAVSILLARWLLVAEQSSLHCYDSRSDQIAKSRTTLMQVSEDRPILRVFSAGKVREEGNVAFAVLVFKDAFTIVKMLMDEGRPCGSETVFTSIPMTVEGWTDLIDVRLHHRLLVVTIGDCASDWESSGRLVLLDVDTLRRYRIPTDHVGLRTVTFFYATKTHLVEVTESGRNYPFESELRCFPLPTAHEALDNDTLYPSHRSGTLTGDRMRQHTVIRDLGASPTTGRVLFVVFGPSPDGNGLDMAEITLKPDGGIVCSQSRLCRFNMASFCVASNERPGCGIALGTDARLVAFAVDHHGPRALSYGHHTISHKFPECALMPLDIFDGTVFLSHRSSEGTSIKMIDFNNHAESAEGCCPDDVTDCQCSYCQDPFDDW